MSVSDQGWMDTIKKLEEGDMITIQYVPVVEHIAGMHWSIHKEYRPQQYKIQRQLGVGGQGAVYEAADFHNPKKRYVIKQLIPKEACDAASIGFSSWNPSAEEEKDAEIQHALKLRRESKDGPIPKRVCDSMFIREMVYSIVFGKLGVSPTVYGFDLNRYCIVMQPLDRTLSQIVKEKTQLTKTQWVRLFEIERIVSQENVAHNDKRLQNYMANRDGQLYIIDWGAATHIDGTKSKKKYPNSGMGYLNTLVPNHKKRFSLTWAEAADLIGINADPPV